MLLVSKVIMASEGSASNGNRFVKCSSCQYKWNWSRNLTCYQCSKKLAFAHAAAFLAPSQSLGKPWVDRFHWKQHFWPNKGGGVGKQIGAKWPKAKEAAPVETTQQLPESRRAALQQHLLQSRSWSRSSPLRTSLLKGSRSLSGRRTFPSRGGSGANGRSLRRLFRGSQVSRSLSLRW